MGQDTSRRDWTPVAPTWEHNPDDKEIWRRVVVMPSLALNRIELELLGAVAGQPVCVLGAGEGLAPLALAAMGSKVTVVDPTHSLLDLLMVRSQVTGVELQYLSAELTDLSRLRAGTHSIFYAAQVASQLEDLGKFYSGVYRVMAPAGRLVVNEYHPFRRIWKPETGSPRVSRSYFQRRYERTESDIPSPANQGSLGRYQHHWAVSDHFYFLAAAGFRVVALEEVGDVKQHWELTNLRGLPEQLIIAADKPE